jgi:DNA polymerase-3 subunit delta
MFPLRQENGKIKDGGQNRFLLPALSKHMIIFLYGEDTYRMKEKLGEIVQEYNKTNKSSFNLRALDFSVSENFAKFKEEIFQPSMFKEKKIYILDGCFGNERTEENFLELVKGILSFPDIVIVREQDKVKKTSKLFKFLEQKAKCQEFEELTGSKLKTWANKEAKENNAIFEPRALDVLLERVGGDSWRLAGEIKKMASFSFSKKNDVAKITQETVEVFVKPKIEADIFRTIDAIAQKDRKTALKMTREHLNKGDAPLYLMSMINYQFRNILAVKDMIEKGTPYPVMVKELGAHPFVLKKSVAQAQRFSLIELKRIYRKLLQLDVEIKTGRVEPEMAIETLIAEI